MILKPDSPAYLRYVSQPRHLMSAWEDAGRPALRTVCECAVGPFSLVSGFAEHCRRLLLIEPDPRMARHARLDHPTADVVEAAITDDEGTANLRQLNGASYIKGIGWAPAFQPQHVGRIKRAGKVRVKTLPFCAVDDGEIDLMNLDCEGSEWFVLKNMISRPAILQIELYQEHANYAEIQQWLDVNAYMAHATWGNANRIMFRTLP